MVGHTRSEERRALASEALDRLGEHRSEHELLVIQCARSHHLAEVVSTDAGPVFVSRTGPHSHGRKDLPDLGRHGAPTGLEFVDLVLDPLSGDDLPVWCTCGPRQLSREWVVDGLRGHQRTLHV
jgi:hypothetical protein